MEENETEKGVEVATPRNAIISPATGISLGMLGIAISVAVFVNNGLMEARAEAGRTREVLSDIKSSLSEIRKEQRELTQALQTHEAWSARVATELRMGLNEVRLKTGLRTLQSLSVPYANGGGHDR